MLEFGYLNYHFEVKSNDNYDEYGYIVTCRSVENKIYQSKYSNDDIRKLNIGKSENFYNLFKKVSENKINLEIKKDNINDCLEVYLKLLEPIEYDIVLNLNYLENVKEEVHDNIVLTKIIKELKDDNFAFKNEIIVLKDELTIIKNELDELRELVKNQYIFFLEKYNYRQNLENKIEEYYNDIQHIKKINKLNISKINFDINKIHKFNGIIEDNFYININPILSEYFNLDDLKKHIANTLMIKYKIKVLNITFQRRNYFCEDMQNKNQYNFDTAVELLNTAKNFKYVNCETIIINTNSRENAEDINFETFPLSLKHLTIKCTNNITRLNDKIYNYKNLNKLINLETLVIKHIITLGSLTNLYNMICETKINKIILNDCGSFHNSHIFKEHNIELIIS